MVRLERHSIIFLIALIIATFVMKGVWGRSPHWESGGFQGGPQAPLGWATKPLGKVREWLVGWGDLWKNIKMYKNLIANFTIKILLKTISSARHRDSVPSTMLWNAQQPRLSDAYVRGAVTKAHPWNLRYRASRHSKLYFIVNTDFWNKNRK